MSPTIRALQALLVALNAFFAGLAASSILLDLDPNVGVVAAAGMLGVTSAQLGLNTFMNGTVVENVDHGKVVAGPANELPTGTVVREVGDLSYTPERAHPDDI